MTPSDGWGVRVRAASRLSFTLIDLNGTGGRRNGMASLALCEPQLRMVLMPAPRTAFHCDEQAAVYIAGMKRLLGALRRRWKGPPVEVTIEEGVPPQAGLGSKSTTLVALGKAYAVLCGRSITTGELARITGRGGTSGGSVNLIDQGGFVVDGGHANPEDFDDEPIRYLVPSRFAGGGGKPPTLIRLEFPPWPILMISCRGRGLHGTPELEWFRGIVPMPVRDAHKTAHLVFMNLAPAIADRNYRAFCRAVNVLTEETYYKRKQIATHSNALQKMITEAVHVPDIDAFGMSSMGPTCYAFTRNPAAAVAWLEQWRAQELVDGYWFTSAQNHPVSIEGAAAIPGDRP